MPLYRDEAERLLRDHHGRLLEGLDIHLSFLHKLWDDDDWSFVIKVQAFIEASVTDLLVTHVGDEKLKSLIELLPLADEKIGKLAIAKALGLMSPEQRRFVRTMATLRNKLAHRVDHIEFTFSDHVLSLNASALKDWKQSLIWFPTGDSHDYWYLGAESQPKVAIWLGTFLLVAQLLIAAKEADAKRKINAAALQTGEELYRHNCETR